MIAEVVFGFFAGALIVVICYIIWHIIKEIINDYCHV